MKKLFFFLALASLALKLPAPEPPIPEAPTLTIKPYSTNAETVTANVGSTLFPNAVLQASTNLASTNWINVQSTIYIGAGPIVFTNVPATNAFEFFRLYEY